MFTDCIFSISKTLTIISKHEEKKCCKVVTPNFLCKIKPLDSSYPRLYCSEAVPNRWSRLKAETIIAGIFDPRHEEK